MFYTPYNEEEFIPKQNKKIYHYTSPGAMKSILENRTLRFTDCQFLNDKSEYTYFGSVLEEAIHELSQAVHSRTIELIQDIYDDNYDAEGRIIGRRKSDSDHGYYFRYIPSRYYVFCTSLGQDSLNMWNYYVKSGNYQGYNLGLQIQELAGELEQYNSSRIDIYGGKVLYRRKEQVEVLKRYIQDMDKQLKKLEEIDAEDLFQGVQEEMLDRIQYYRLLFKHNSFNSEREYRFILKAPRDMEEEDVKGIQAGFYESHGIFVPYCDVSLKMNALKSVRMAPMVEAGIAKEGLARFLHMNGYDETVAILTSEVPIRY